MKTIRRRRRRSSLEARLVAYSAMAGAALATAPVQAADCLGGVVLGTACYTDIPDVTLTDDGTVPVDLDGDGDAEFAVRFFRTTWVMGTETTYHSVNGQLSGDALSSLLAGFTSSARGPSAGRPGALLAGDVVGLPGVGSWTREGSLFYVMDFCGIHSAGNWFDRADRFVGVKVRLDQETTHFGWARLSVGNPFFTGITVKDYAFDLVPGGPVPTSLETLAQLFADGFESGDASAWSAWLP